MTALTTTPLCMGITAAQATAFATTNIAGHEMAKIPGGLTVIGSEEFDDSPRWVLLSPYYMGETAVSLSQFSDVMRECVRPYLSKNHPANNVIYDDAVEYLKRCGRGLVLPTEAQWECAARGPAVNIPELMEAELGRYSKWDIVDFVEGRFENFVFGVLGSIFTDLKSHIFQELIDEGRPFFGWRVYGTPSGRLSHKEAWFAQDEMVPVDWGPRNAYGLFNMTGNVYEWVQGWDTAKYYWMMNGVDPVNHYEGWERIARGGDRWESDPDLLRVTHSYGIQPDEQSSCCGFRVAAPLGSKG